MSGFDFSQFFTTFLFYILWILIVILIWNFYWLSPFTFNLPDYNTESDDEFPITNAYTALSYLYHILYSNFDPQFWLKHCGFDALAYITFIRRMFCLVLLYFLISLVFGIPYAFAHSESDSLWNSFNLHDEIYKIYLQMFFLILFSCIFYGTLYEMKWYLLQSYSRFIKKSRKLFELETNTLRLKRLPEHYETLDLRQKIQEILPKTHSDSIIKCVLIPDSLNLLEIYSRKKELEFLKGLSKGSDSKSYGCSHHQKIDEELIKIDLEIESIKKKGYKFSGNAFVCVDSNESFQKIINSFSLFHLSFWRKICNCSKNTSNEHSPLLKNEENNVILASSIPSPDDISWRNLNKESNISWIKRLGLNILAMTVMLFFTTPASLITVLGVTDILEGWFFDNPQPGSFSNLIEKNLSPMLIILVNQLLLLLIDTLSLKKHVIRLSETQLTIFNLCLFYMLINNFIIPALSMTTVESLFSFLSNNNVEKVETLLKTFYLKDTGSLFIILLIQAGTFSFTFYLLRISDLFWNYFDRRLICEKRQRRLMIKNWLRDETDNFQYGYFYASMVIYLIVVLVFSTTVPAISLSGVFLFFLRLVCDGFELISAHRKEIDSGGKMIHRVIICCCFGGFFFQILMLAYYSASKLKYNMFLMATLTVGSMLFTIKISRMTVFHAKEEDDEKGIDTEELKKWEKGYRHPLLHKKESFLKI